MHILFVLVLIDLKWKMIMPIIYRILSTVIGFVLLAAAFLKLMGLAISPVAQTGILHHPAIVVMIIEGELIVGACLLSGMRPVLVSKLTIGLFSLFTLASGFAFFNGAPTCDCFGPIRMKPLYVCIFDAGVVFAFLYCGPKETILYNPLPLKAFRPILGGIGLSVFALGIFHVFQIDPAIAFAKLNGRTAVVYPVVLDLGQQKAGKEVHSSIKVSNLGVEPIYIAGGSSDCTCIVTDNLPCHLPGGKDIDLPIRIKLPDATGSFQRQAFLWTDAYHRKLSFKITGVMAR